MSGGGGGIFITGASAGIGWALAQALAAPGVTLGLTARRMERLETLQGELEGQGAKVLIYKADVRETDAMAKVAGQFIKAAGGVKMVIANAGISSSGRLELGGAGPLNEVIAVNVMGVINTIAPFVPHMIRQGSGHLVAISSVAAFRGLPGRADYNGSKAAVNTMMDGFRLELKKHGISVTTICPGFVESEMTARNTFKMPFLLKADTAAQHILKAIRRNRKTYVFPWQWRVLLPLVVRLPDWLMPQVR